MSKEVKKIINLKLYSSEEFTNNKHKITQFIKEVNNLQINEDLFKIIRILIKHFRFPILVLFRPIYSRIQLERQRYLQEYHQQLIKTAGIVRAILKEKYFPSLQFYFKSGSIGMVELKENINQQAFIDFIMQAENRLNQKVCDEAIDQSKRLKDIQEYFRKGFQSSSICLQKLCIEYYLKEVQERHYEIQKQMTLQKQKQIKNENKSHNVQSKQSKTTNEFLCCRSFFYENQIIDQPQTLVQEYKHYDYPFNRYLKDVLLKTICGFLNGRGGIIYIGIKQDFETKQRVVVGQIFTENVKENLLKYFRVLCQKISPEIVNQQLYKLQFVPIKNSKNEWIPGRFIARLKVEMGDQRQLYSYQKLDGQELFAFRTQNQVLSRRMGQQIIQIYRKRLNSNQQRVGYLKHNGICKPVEMGKQVVDSIKSKVKSPGCNNQNKSQISNVNTKKSKGNLQEFKKCAFVCYSALNDDLKKYNATLGKKGKLLFIFPRDINEQKSIDFLCNIRNQSAEIIKISKMLQLPNTTIAKIQPFLSKILYTQINQNTIAFTSFDQVIETMNLLTKSKISYNFVFPTNSSL